MVDNFSENGQLYSQNPSNGENSTNNDNNMYHAIIPFTNSEDSDIANVLAAEVEECVIDGFAVETFLSLRDLKIYVSKLEPPRPFADGELSARNKRRLPTNNSNMTGSRRKRNDDSSRITTTESYSPLSTPMASKLESTALDGGSAQEKDTNERVPVSSSDGDSTHSGAFLINHRLAGVSCNKVVQPTDIAHVDEEDKNVESFAVALVDTVIPETAASVSSDVVSPVCVDLSKHAESTTISTSYDLTRADVKVPQTESDDSDDQPGSNLKIDENRCDLAADDDSDDDDKPTDLSATHSRPVTSTAALATTTTIATKANTNVVANINENSLQGSVSSIAVPSIAALPSSENSTPVNIPSTIPVENPTTTKTSCPLSSSPNESNSTLPISSVDKQTVQENRQILINSSSKFPNVVKTPPAPHPPGGNTEWLGRLLAIAARAAIENCNSNHNIAPERRPSPLVPLPPTSSSGHADVRTNENNLLRQQISMSCVSNSSNNGSLSTSQKSIPSNLVPVSNVPTLNSSHPQSSSAETAVPIVKRDSLFAGQECNLDAPKPSEIPTRQGSLMRPPVGASNFDSAVLSAPAVAIGSFDPMLPSSLPLRFGEQFSQRFLYPLTIGTSSGQNGSSNKDATTLQQQHGNSLSGVKRPYQQNISHSAALLEQRPINKFPPEMPQSETKKRGIWCTAHVRIAWFIYQQQQQQQNSTCDSSKLAPQTIRSTSLAHSSAVSNTSAPADSLGSASKRIAPNRDNTLGKRLPESLLDPFLPSAFLALTSASSQQKQPSSLPTTNFRESHAPVAVEQRSGGNLSLPAVIERAASGMIKQNDLLPPSLHRQRSPPIINNANNNNNFINDNKNININSSSSNSSNNNNNNNNNSLQNPALWTSPFSMTLGGLGSFGDRGGGTTNSGNVFSRSSDPFATAARQLAGGTSPGIIQFQQHISLDNKRRQAEQLLSVNENSAARAVQAFANSVESLIAGSTASTGCPPSSSSIGHSAPPSLMEMMRLFAPSSSNTVSVSEMSHAPSNFPPFIAPPQQQHTASTRSSAASDPSHSLLDASFAPFLAAAALAASTQPPPPPPVPSRSHGIPSFLANTASSVPPSVVNTLAPPVPLSATEQQNSQVAAAVQLQLSSLFGGGFPGSRAISTQSSLTAPWQNSNLAQVSSNPFMFPQLPRR